MLSVNFLKNKFCLLKQKCIKKFSFIKLCYNIIKKLNFVQVVVQKRKWRIFLKIFFYKKKNNNVDIDYIEYIFILIQSLEKISR